MHIPNNLKKQKDHRKTICPDIIKQFLGLADMLKNDITSTINAIQDALLPGMTKVRIRKSKLKAMMIVSFDITGMAKFELIPESQAINQKL
ncbi:hypothetical protein PR048_025423 [Dryococelus australis]|uniref:Transposase n=1 Tax=Dryococelus australis TaxID=614101 RepID=A0ABQ9GRC8_9NEOP|nr:hypothetical protein PR048_025423 [Dryococelus australis]